MGTWSNNVKYKKSVLGMLLAVGTVLVPLAGESKMPTDMKIYMLQTLMSSDKKTQKVQNAKPAASIKTEKVPQPVKKQPVWPQSEKEKKISQKIIFALNAGSRRLFSV